MNLKALRIGTQMKSELFSSIVVTCGSAMITQIENCPSGKPSERCTFQDCLQSDSSIFSPSQLIFCPERGIEVEIKFKNDEDSKTCKWKNEPASSVTQISLFPVHGMLPS